MHYTYLEGSSGDPASMMSTASVILVSGLRSSLRTVYNVVVRTNLSDRGSERRYIHLHTAFKHNLSLLCREVEDLQGSHERVKGVKSDQ